LPGLKPTVWECHKFVLPNRLFKKAQRWLYCKKSEIRSVISRVGKNLNDIRKVAYTRFLASLEMTLF